jgi:hypothetical protein
MAQHPTQHATLYIATFEKGKGGIQITHDGGATWSSLLSVADNDFIQELKVAPSDPSIVYASGEVFDDTGKFTHYIARSADAGMTFERSEIAVLEVESDFELLSVSPKDPQFLVAHTIARDPSTANERLLLSHDGGRTFSSPFDAERIYDVSFATGSDTLWVGTIMALWRSPDAGKTFEKIAGQQVILSCVTEHEGALWACGYFGNGSDGLSISSDGGGAFQTRMDFADVSQPITCPASAPTAATCSTPWVDWQREILGPISPVGGAGGTGGTAGVAGIAGSGGATATSAAVLGATAGAPSPALVPSGVGVARPRPSGCAIATGETADRDFSLVPMLAMAWLLHRTCRRSRRH